MFACPSKSFSVSPELTIKSVESSFTLEKTKQIKPITVIIRLSNGIQTSYRISETFTSHV